MRKIILALFIILFCFSIGIAELQEEELSKEEIKIIKKQKEKEVIIDFLMEELEKLIEEVGIPLEEDPKVYYGEMASICEEISNSFKKMAMLSREIVDLEKERELIRKQDEEKGIYELMKEASESKEKKDLSWEEKYRMYPSTKYWFDSLKEPDERYLEKIEEENDRLEDLLEEIRNERFRLEQDIISYRWDLEVAKPNPLDYYVAAELGISLAMMDIELGIYPYYLTYSTKTDPTNYEPLLFTLCTDSKGKMDWTKYGWLKLLLKEK